MRVDNANNVGRRRSSRSTARPHARIATEGVPPRYVHEASGDAESGRGLLLVARLSTCWATAPRPAAPGKTVWAELTS